MWSFLLFKLDSIGGMSALQREYRLNKEEDFSRVYEHKKSVANNQLILYFYKNNQTPHFRLGFSINKKVGIAVERNRLRRILKEIFRKHKDEIKSHYDFVLVVRKGAAGLDYFLLEKSVLHILKKAKLLQGISRPGEKEDGK